MEFDFELKNKKFKFETWFLALWFGEIAKCTILRQVVLFIIIKSIYSDRSVTNLYCRFYASEEVSIFVFVYVVSLNTYFT